MELLFVLGVAALLVWLAKRKPASRAPKLGDQVVIPISLRVSTTVDGHGLEPVDSGALTESPDGAWVLNPKSPLPLTILGAEWAVATQLKTWLDDEIRFVHREIEIAFLIARHNLRCREIDQFVEANRAAFEAFVAQRVTTSEEWGTASARDREDLRREFEQDALENLPLSAPAHLGTECLLRNQSHDATVDDALLPAFGGDAETYRFFMSRLSSTAVTRVPADDHWRKDWDGLAKRGLARRGQAIPMADILDSLRMKDINELFRDRLPKPLSRKAKAVEFALSQPDVAERVAASVGTRELFQLVPPPGVDVAGLRTAFEHATATSRLLIDTYRSGGDTLRERLDSERPTAWEIEHPDSPIPACAQKRCKRSTARPSRLPPFHAGCQCQLRAVWS